MNAKQAGWLVFSAIWLVFSLIWLNHDTQAVHSCEAVSQFLSGSQGSCGQQNLVRDWLSVIAAGACLTGSGAGWARKRSKQAQERRSDW